MPLNLPNRITLLRIAMIPVLVLCAVQARELPALRWLALGILLASLASDALDGWLARRRGETSRLGAFLDPLADKLLFTTLFVCLVLPLWPDPAGAPPRRLLPLWVAVVTISRDLYISLGALVVFMATGGLHIRPSRCGKAATAAFAALGVAALAQGVPPAFLDVLVWAAVALAGVTWVQYTRDGMQQLAQAQHLVPPKESHRETHA